MKVALLLVALFVVSIIPASFAQTITIETNKEQFDGGDIVIINGNIQDGKSKDIAALEIKDPDNETILIRTVTLDNDGSFSLKFKIPESSKSGSYDIVVNSQQNGQTITETKTITQMMPPAPQEPDPVPQEPDPAPQEPDPVPQPDKSGGCLIATATYGSELAPQVQQLRELRDGKLLKTESGTHFMNSFNEFYYIFSPTIADMERENPLFRELIKATITPMLLSLSVMEYADSEAEILGYGTSLIMLNLGMYFGVPAVIVSRLLRK